MYRLFVTDTQFIMRKDNLNDKALVIDRQDSSSLQLVPKNELSLPQNNHGRTVFCCLGIFRALRESYLVVVTESDVVGSLLFQGTEQNVIRKINQTDFISFSTGRGRIPMDPEEKPFTQVMNLLNSGHFYWVANGSSYDITRTYQAQTLDPKSQQPCWDRVDKRFYWNKYLQKDFIASRLYDWCFPVIQGYVCHNNLGDIGGKNVTYTLVSRRSRFRAGTRFNTRGVDDDGNVANFVETEQIITIRDFGTLSFIQVRGSVPVFWNQSSPQFTDFKLNMANLGKIGKISKKKISVLRAAAATSPAFQQHFKEQSTKYGAVSIINLLSKLKAGEADLVNAYEEQLKIMNSSTVHYYPFDLNEQLKGNRMDGLDSLIDKVDPQHPQRKVGYFFIDRQRVVTSRQNGTIRTNCKDCLDRTNIVQARVAWKLFEAHLKQLGLIRPMDSLDFFPHIAQMLKTMWADNGDALSIQYAGSGSLKSTLTREGDYGIKGMLADGKKTMTRFYVNNFKDTGRQDVLDQLLGLHQQQANGGGGVGSASSGTDDRIRKQVQERKDEYSKKEYKNVFVGTYNVGGVPSDRFDLDRWLDVSSYNYPSPELYVLGIQEVVELTATQIIATDSQIKQWEDTIKRSLERVNPSAKYVQLQSNQLVGLMMCIYVREDIVHLFRDVQSQIIKVGLQGLTGNKGGIGVRLSFCDTTFTFVTAHFAAGHGNVEDRISDYIDINNQARFGRQNQYRVDDSDYSFWFGDFNFRIDLMDADIKRSIYNKNLSLLYDNDQLKKSMDAKRAFFGYREDTITFAPTYKYDFGSTQYDTSPKQRAPAWTDRILWRHQQNHDLRQLYYGRSELMESDHRPVSSYFQLQVVKIDKEKERQLRHQLMNEQDSQAKLDGANLSKSTPGGRPNLLPPMIQTQSAPILNNNNNNNGFNGNSGPPLPARKLSQGHRPLPVLPNEVVQEIKSQQQQQQQTPHQPVTTSRVRSNSPSTVSLPPPIDTINTNRSPSPNSRSPSPLVNINGNNTSSGNGSNLSNNFNNLNIHHNGTQSDPFTEDLFASQLPTAPTHSHTLQQPIQPIQQHTQPPPQQQQQQQQNNLMNSNGIPSNPFMDNSPMVPNQPNAITALSPQYHQQPQLPPQQPMVLLTPTQGDIQYIPPTSNAMVSPQYHQPVYYNQQPMSLQQYVTQPTHFQQHSPLPPPIDPINLNPNAPNLFYQQQQQQQMQMQMRYSQPNNNNGPYYNNNNGSLI